MQEPAELARQAEQLDDERWFDFLDELDVVARRRRHRLEEAPDGPASGARDDVAAWVAKQHRIADSGVREVWYLPEGAPPDEIRLLEVNDRFAGDGSTVRPQEFALRERDADFRLKIVDLTSDLLDRIKRDPALLPAGWSLAGRWAWGRRA